MKKNNKPVKRVLIGGGAGYIGSVLSPFLKKKGYKITVIDLLWFGNHLPKNIRVIREDLFNISRKELKGYDQFIFLAGLSNDPMAHFNPKLNYLHNAALPSYLAYECKMAGVKRFIYGSSCSVYGNTTKLCSESTPPLTSEPYGISKLQGEWGILQNQSKEFSTIVLRQGTVCGYSPRMRFDLAINTMVKSALTTNNIVVDNANIWRPICGMNDILKAYVLSINSKPSLNGIFNIASDNYSILTVARMVKKLFKNILNKNINISLHNKKIERNYRVDLRNSFKKLGFIPHETLKSIITEVILESKKINNFSDDNYYNINVFKRIKPSTKK